MRKLIDIQIIEERLNAANTLSRAMIAYGVGPKYLASAASPSNPDRYGVMHLIVRTEDADSTVRALAKLYELREKEPLAVETMGLIVNKERP